MRAVKEPKTFKRPRLYMRKTDTEFRYEQRLRIVWPDGTAWYDVGIDAKIKNDNPCWTRDVEFAGERVNYHNQLSPLEKIKEMKAYDKFCGYETIFLGEL